MFYKFYSRVVKFATSKGHIHYKTKRKSKKFEFLKFVTFAPGSNEVKT